MGSEMCIRDRDQRFQFVDEVHPIRLSMHNRSFNSMFDSLEYCVCNPNFAANCTNLDANVVDVFTQCVNATSVSFDVIFVAINPSPAVVVSVRLRGVLSIRSSLDQRRNDFIDDRI